jgi:GxxExxY protein
MASAGVATKPSVHRTSGLTLSAAMKVHSTLGPGLLESAYAALRKRGLRAQDQLKLPVVHDGVTIDLGYRMDLVVEGLVVVKLKCVEEFSRVHQAQLLSYLKLSGINVGLLLNFHVAHLRDGIKRFGNGRNWER